MSSCQGLQKCGLSKHDAVEIVAADYGAGWADESTVCVVATDCMGTQKLHKIPPRTRLGIIQHASC